MFFLVYIFLSTPILSEQTCGKTGNAGIHTYIRNGEGAALCEWRFHVGLKMAGSDQYFCGGTLIGERVVLTAAHCLRPQTFQMDSATFVERLELVIGEHDVELSNHTEIVLKAHGYKRQHDFAISDVHGSATNDVALIYLKDPVKPNQCHGFACLPSRSVDLPAGLPLMAIGFGNTRSGMDPARILQEVQLEVWDKEKCRLAYGPAGDQIDENMFCAYSISTDDGTVRDVLKGDSGGGLFLDLNPQGTPQYMVAGLVSWGAHDKPSVMAQISGASLEFVRTNLPRYEDPELVMAKKTNKKVCVEIEDKVENTITSKR